MGEEGGQRRGVRGVREEGWGELGRRGGRVLGRRGGGELGGRELGRREERVSLKIGSASILF